ncbi:MAG: hypothetical protein N3A71_03290 [Candidatus Dojkabacteria bacterium]|nr:hypothetical protein [Candidatus Dojkabacteria bacterium]
MSDILVWGFIAISSSVIFHIFHSRKNNFAFISEGEKVKIANKKVRVDKLAKIFKPIIYIDKNFSDINLKPTYLQMIAVSVIDDRKNNKIFLNYHLFWNDEYYPVKIIDKIYRIFREFYYGTSIDIEFIRLTVCKFTGKLEEIHFESPKTALSNYFLNSPIIMHRKLVLKFKNNILYLYKKGILRRKKEIKKIFIYSFPPAFKIISWNHLLSYIPNSSNEKTLLPIDMPMQFLNLKDIKKYRLYRRSGCVMYVQK